MTGIEPRRRGERLRVEQCAEMTVGGAEGMTGIEPALSAWEAEVLPLNYIPEGPYFLIYQASCSVQLTRVVPSLKARRWHGISEAQLPAQGFGAVRAKRVPYALNAEASSR